MVTVKDKFSYLADGNIDIDSWFNKITYQYQLNDVNLIRQATVLAQVTSKGITTYYGQPCIEQSLEMAEILLDLSLDQNAVAAAIITPTIQHTSLTIETIKKELGDAVTALVNGTLQMNSLNKLQANVTKNRDQTQIDRLRKIFLSIASDIRVVLIKLAERTCIMRGIKQINLVERKRIAQETLDIYAPLANRLGVGQLKWELEDIAFHYTHPDEYKTIAKFLAERRIDREKRIHDTIARLKETLAKENITADITGRAKHIYSIYLKMQRKDVEQKNIFDYSAVRILVPTLEDCYTALSVVHSLFEHIQEEFDDYITNPKPNGYRSIHTAVIGPDGKNLEIQIRTKAMHEEAEHGIAAHWLYKEAKSDHAGYEDKITFLRQLLAWHKEVAQHDIADSKRIDEILEDSVYVFTPAGDIVDLPVGSTPLDFAYHIHSEIGHRYRGAKIKGHIVPLTYKLRTGDQIEIITTPNGTPSRDWLNKEFGYIFTTRARAKVAHWFKQKEVTQYVESGKVHLQRELSRAGIVHPNFEKVATRLNYKNDEALFAAIGHGNLRIAHVIHTIRNDHEPKSPTTPSTVSLATPAVAEAGLEIAGINDLLTRVARCCKPIPGDHIIGYITQGRGVSIHREDCSNIKSYLAKHDNRLIHVAWDSKKVGTYYVDLQVRASSGHHSLNEITALLVNAKINLIKLNSTINKKSNMIYILMTIQIHDLAQMNHIMHQIGQLPDVMGVKRMSESVTR